MHPNLQPRPMLAAPNLFMAGPWLPAARGLKQPAPVIVKAPISQILGLILKVASLFFKLPVEIRYMIYKLVFNNILDPKDLNFLLSCRQIYHEAHQIAYSRVPVLVDHEPILSCSPYGGICKHGKIDTAFYLRPANNHRVTNLWVPNRYWRCQTTLMALSELMPMLRTITIPDVPPSCRAHVLSNMVSYAAKKMLARGDLGKSHSELNVTVRIPDMSSNIIRLAPSSGLFTSPWEGPLSKKRRHSQVYFLCQEPGETVSGQSKPALRCRLTVHITIIGDPLDVKDDVSKRFQLPWPTRK